MHRMALLVVGLAVAIAAGVAGSAQAATTGKLPPLGYQLMCLKHPDQCKGGGAGSVKSDSHLLATLHNVNRRINKSMIARRDGGGRDVWTPNAGVGDCEDFALAKREALIRAGVAPSSLRLTYVKTPAGEDHTVLVVKTTTATWVLDNLTSAILPLSRSGLKVVSMAGSDPLRWS
jgi:predicted transglutaminase-like cysteine proteinase